MRTTRGSYSGSSTFMVAVGVVVGLIIAFALVILLVLLYRKRKSKDASLGPLPPNLGPQQSNGQSSTSQQTTASGGAVAGTSDVVYADIDLKEKGAKKRRQKAETSAAKPDTLYSALKPVKTTDKGAEDGTEPRDGSNVTYSDVTIKQKGLKRQDSAGPSDVTYSDVQIKMKPLKTRTKPTSSKEEHIYSNISRQAPPDAGSGDATYAQVKKKGKKPGSRDA